MSVILATCSNVAAQTIETIMRERNQINKSPQIMVGDTPTAIAVNTFTNKIYVANLGSHSVSVIDSNSGNEAKNIRVGTNPNSIAIDWINNKIYVANTGSNTVSVINASTGIKEPHDIPVGKGPIYIAALQEKIYVANKYNNSVSVISKKTKNIPVGEGPSEIAVNSDGSKIYVLNFLASTVSVINSTTDKKEPNDIPVGKYPIFIAVEEDSKLSVPTSHSKIYVANKYNNSISVINGSTDKKEPNDIPVGNAPYRIAFNPSTNLTYIVNQDSNTVSVVNGFSNNVAAGVTLNIHPANSGKIMCDKKEYPTNSTFMWTLEPNV